MRAKVEESNVRSNVERMSPRGPLWALLLSLPIWAIIAILWLAIAANAATSASAPAITEVEQLKLENLQLKASQIQMQMKELQDQFTQIQQDYKDLTGQIEKEHPGYAWDGKGLTAKPDPVAAPATIPTPAASSTPQK